MAGRKKEEMTDLLAKLAVGMAILVFFGAFKITQSFVASGIAAAIVLGIAFALAIMARQARMEKLRRSGIHDIDKMEGRQFEIYLGELFKKNGFTVEVTRSSGDYGADLVIKKDGRKIVVQAKRHSRNVGLKAVQEVQASLAHYGASEAWVVSNRDYTDAAVNLAKSNHVRLFSREDLIKMVLQMNPGTAPDPKQIVHNNPIQKVICDRCGCEMVLRRIYYKNKATSSSIENT